MTDIFKPTKFPEDGYVPPYFMGVEGYLLGGGGLSLVICCDENCNKNYFLFFKAGGGAALGVSGAIGPIKGMDKENCDYRNYEGWFFEAGGSIAFFGGGVDVGVNDSNVKIPLLDVPLPSNKFSGVIEGGAGPCLGPLQVKAAWLRYYKIWEYEEPGGCLKKM